MGDAAAKLYPHHGRIAVTQVRRAARCEPAASSPVISTVLRCLRLGVAGRGDSVRHPRSMSVCVCGCVSVWVSVQFSVGIGIPFACLVFKVRRAGRAAQRAPQLTLHHTTPASVGWLQRKTLRASDRGSWCSRGRCAHCWQQNSLSACQLHLGYLGSHTLSSVPFGTPVLAPLSLPVCLHTTAGPAPQR